MSQPDPQGGRDAAFAQVVALREDLETAAHGVEYPYMAVTMATLAAYGREA